MKSAEEYIREAQSASNGTTEVDANARAYAHDGMLANDVPPPVSLQKEAPQHVLMVYMQASGKSNKEIAQATGYTAQAVGNILRQPWARQRFLRIAQEAGSSAVQSFLDTQVLPSLETLIEVRDTGTGATRVAAANAILDRALGKPTLFLKSETVKGVDDVLKEREQLERELSGVRSELAARGLDKVGGVN